MIAIFVLVLFELFFGGYLFDSLWVFGFVLEIDGFEEGLRRNNPQHGERGGGTYCSVGEKSSAVSKGALFD